MDMDLLLRLLNASEGLDDRGAFPPRTPDPLDSEPLPPVVSVAEPAGTDPVDDSGATTDVENRFAAHIVRGMSKSKAGRN
jgi:hypothetical protein